MIPAILRDGRGGFGTCGLLPFDVETLLQNSVDLPENSSKFISSNGETLRKWFSGLEKDKQDLLLQYAIPLDIPFHLFSVFGSLFGFLLSSSNTGIRGVVLKGPNYTDRSGKQNSGKNAEKKEKFAPCGICQRENHLEKDCWYKGKGPIQCRFCKKMGHIEKNCRKKQGQTNQQQANCVEDGEEPSESLFMVSQGSCSYDGGIWLVDSGCTSHMCKEEKMFCDLDKTVKIRVTLRNGEVMQSQGKGSVTVATRQGTRTIHNVLFVPGLSQNLLSVAQMISHGYTVMFKKKICFIYDLKGKLLAEVEMTNNTFPLHWYKCYDVAMHVSSDESFLWHRHFGHFNFSALKLMSSRGYTKDLPLINDGVDVCKSCCLGKMHRRVVKRTKLSEKAQLGIFLGYAATSKGYRVYVIQEKGVVVSRDVVFLEDAYWNWEKNQVEKETSNKVSQNNTSLLQPNLEPQDGVEETEFRDSTDAGEGQSHEVETPPDSPVRKYKSLTDVLLLLMNTDIPFHLFSVFGSLFGFLLSSSNSNYYIKLLALLLFSRITMPFMLKEAENLREEC
ncbi:Retrovirus-related Pol polyprotein from transposon TNT 1-94 [Senna tora]|uniref:Retrovirus-related Pol polyprotein from transposon TNT 1-94 n=1 Tax=Senna tora TaxID=362788 RepID=A0A835CEW1_9FABA|nr:Retrovirus-related Pol polyprotein from transposon TNT 1-94 [Senna tora]